MTQIIRFLLLLTLTAPIKLHAQVDAGADTIACIDSVKIGASAVNPVRSTDDYLVKTFTYSPTLPFSQGTLVPISDDQVSSPPLNIGFNFCFYNQTYDKVFISDNGWISFLQPNALARFFQQYTLPNTNAQAAPRALIALTDDWRPNGKIRSYTTGSAPFRKFIVNYDGLSHYNSNCQNVTFVGQIVLYETTNVIEFNIENKGLCELTALGQYKSVHGIQDETGTKAVVVNGRNSTFTFIQNETTQFVPNGNSTAFEIAWLENGTAISEPKDSIFYHPTGTHTLVAQLTYLCTGATFTDTIVIKRDLTALTTSATQASCFKSADGTATVIASGESSFTYSWNDPQGQNTPTATGLAAGNYQVTVTSVNDCPYTTSVNITEPAKLDLSISSNNEACNRDDGTLQVIPSGGTPPYKYSWSTGGTADKITGLTSGVYFVNIIDDKGCVNNGSAGVGFSEAPIADFSIDPSNGIFKPGQTIVFHDQSSAGGAAIVSWAYDFGDQKGASTSSVSHQYKIAGDVTITLVVKDANNCIDSISKTATIVPEFDIPNIVTPNGDGINDYFVIPFIEKFPATKVEVFNRHGRTVFKSEDYKNDWLPSDLSSGTYYYIISEADVNIHTGFLTISK